MKTFVVLSVVLVILAASFEVDANKAADKAARKEARLAKKQAKQERKAAKAKCAPTVSWSTCVDNSISQTLTPSANADCPVGEPVTNTMACVSTITKDKRGCTFTRTSDFTACGTGAESYSITMASENCASKIPAKKANRSFPCNKPVKMPRDKSQKKNGKRGGKGGKGGKGNKNGNKGGNTQGQ